MSEFIGASVRVDDLNMSRTRVRDSGRLHFNDRVRDFQRWKNADSSAVQFKFATNTSFTG